MKHNIRFLKDYTLQGHPYQARDVAELDAAVAESLVTLGYAERAGNGTVVQLTDEQYSRLFGPPTEEEIHAAVQQAGRPDGQRHRPQIRTEADPAVQGDRTAPWRRRTTRYFKALAAGRQNQQRSFEMIAALQREAELIPDRQLLDEENYARQIVHEAPLSLLQKRRLYDALDLGEYGIVGMQTRLHTTSTSDTPKAGYLLPKPFLAEVFVVVEQYGVARRLFRPVPMTSKTLDLKNISSKPTAVWADEGDNITASDLVFAEGQMALKKLAALTSWTTELEEDQAIALLPIAMQLFGEAFMQKEDAAGLVGDGTGSFGGHTGILNLAGATIVTMGSGLTAGNDVAETHVRAAKNALTLARRVDARWIMHYSFHEHIAQFENAAGFRVFQENISGNAPDSLLGFPIEYSEEMPDIDSVGANERFMILGAPNRTLMGMGREFTADVSHEAVLQDGSGNIIFNAFQGDGALLRITERLTFATPAAVQSAYVVIRTAAS
jgi:HK97 family phage major capsid protein